MRRVVARPTCQVTTRVTTCTTKIQTREGRAVLRCFIGWSHHQRLIQSEFSMMPVTTANTATFFQVLWCQQLLVNYLLTNAGSIAGNGIDDPLSKRAAGCLIPATLELERRIHDMR